jgi:hypothetical protein
LVSLDESERFPIVKKARFRIIALSEIFLASSNNIPKVIVTSVYFETTEDVRRRATPRRHHSHFSWNSMQHSIA